MRAAFVEQKRANASSGMPRRWYASSSTSGTVSCITWQPSGAAKMSSQPGSFSSIVYAQ